MGTNNNGEHGSMSLRPKARILRTLGEELISSETVALIELVKNSYDADAKNVLISFDGELQEGASSITVMDDGHGMDMETIANSWMIIATSTKKNNPKSKSGKRRVLGEKGIGRFATSRIADELELFTRTKNQQLTESYAIFDWAQFDNDELFLDEVVFLTEEQEASGIQADWRLAKFAEKKYTPPFHGTLLKMNNLKHSWEKNDLAELQRGLSRLISPFEMINDFSIYLELPDEHDEYTAKISAPDVINYPHYTVKGSVENSGSYEFSVSVETEREPTIFKGFYHKEFSQSEWLVYSSEEEINFKKEDKKQKPIECGPFSFELRVWDRDELGNVIQKVGGGIRSIRKDIDAIAGINIYRDGFRVLPYGEPNNDWLRLDLRRVQKPTMRLSNNQITGYIAITADHNPLLHDRSNREGLDNNEGYDDLQSIMKHILVELENIRYLSKRPEKIKNTKNEEHPGLFDSPDFSLIKESVKSGKLDEKATIGLISQAESDWKKQIKKFQDVLSQYHALATLGGIIDKILHDGRQPLAKIQTEAGLGHERAEDLVKSHPEIKEIKPFEVGFKRIVDQSSVLSDVFRRVEPFGGRKRGRPKKYYIEGLISEIFSIYESDLSAANIKVELPDSETLVSIDTTELSEILTNLITNSIYWLKSVDQSKRHIRVLVSRLNDGALEILFSDTGPGIDAKYKDHIFEPYFSKKPGGHGLGLCLVGEIVHDYYNGSVELLNSGRKGGAVFRIILRKRV